MLNEIEAFYIATQSLGTVTAVGLGAERITGDDDGGRFKCAPVSSVDERRRKGR